MENIILIKIPIEDAKPSTPSIKLNALITKTITKTLNILITGSDI